MKYQINEKVNVIGLCKYSGQNVIIQAIHIQFSPVHYTCKATNGKEILLREDEMQSMYAHDYAMVPPENLTKNMHLIGMSDHQFSAYLNSCDINWRYALIKSDPPSTHYFTPSGQLVAIVVYNNTTCTRYIYLAFYPNVICVWPDNTWCHTGMLHEYGWKSDDYETRILTGYMNDEEIDEIVNS